MIHMKYQALFSLKNNNNKKLEYHSATTFLSTLWVKYYNSFIQAIKNMIIG